MRTRQALATFLLLALGQISTHAQEIQAADDAATKPSLSLFETAKSYWPFSSKAKEIPYSEICIFGDSLSDDGSHGSWVLSNHTWPAYEGYYEGRFSNGPVWIEEVAHSFEIPLRNYAVGGATSDNDLSPGRTGKGSSIVAPSVVDQVAHYIDVEFHSMNIHHTLFLISVGGNDVFFSPEVHAQQTAEKIELVIGRLKEQGAYSFVLVAEPSLANMPYSRSGAISPEVAQQYASYAKEMRKELRRLRLRLQSSKYRLKVAFIDFYTLQEHMMAKPNKYSLSPALLDKSCISGAYGDGPVDQCEDSSQYLFWDEFHMAETGHHHFAREAIHVIKRRFGRKFW